MTLCSLAASMCHTRYATLPRAMLRCHAPLAAGKYLEHCEIHHATFNCLFIFHWHDLHLQAYTQFCF